MKKINVTLTFAFIWIVALIGCTSDNSQNADKQKDSDSLVLFSEKLENSLFNDVLDVWYPMVIDSVNGGFNSEYNYDWTLTNSLQLKAVTQQARHTWATAFVYEAYPKKKQYLEYSEHGFRFLKEHMWDNTNGGFYSLCTKEGKPDPNTINVKQAYAQAFAIYGLSQYYKISKNREALDLAKKAFLWFEEHIHDSINGGYFDVLNEDGSPILLTIDKSKGKIASPAQGLKDFNSSIHIMEAFTQLYSVWPDDLVKKRLEEIFLIIRDTFTHKDGYLQLYFYPDWTLVTDEMIERLAKDNHRYLNHFSYGHDVETAYLLLETEEVLYSKHDSKTLEITKKLVDHSLESGWDDSLGGFFDAGKEIDGKISIVSNKKCWWGQIEGLNALLIMYQMYPNDKNDYWGKFVKMWNYIDNYLVDKEYKGWYNNGLDTSPDDKILQKSHIWKTTYHNARGMIHCIKRLRQISQDKKKN